MKKIFLVMVLVSVSVCLPAQNKTSYFVDNATNRHLLNPAFAPEQGYVGIPFLSNLQASTYSNLGAGTFMFPKGGTTYSFLNKNVSADEFLAGIKPVNGFDVFLNEDIVDFGFRWREHSFWTVNIGFRTEIENDMPYDLFSFVKKGMVDMQSTKYNISNVDVEANSYAQVALGFSSEIPSVEGFRIGGKLKAILGIGSAQISVNRMDVELANSQYTVSSASNGFTAGKWFYLTEDENGKVNGVEIDQDQIGLAGYGAAVDLGLSYTLSTGSAADGLRFSLSAVDFGFIKYNSDVLKDVYSTDGKITYTGAEITRLQSTDFNSTLENIKEDLLDLVAIRQKDAVSGRTKALSGKIYAGVDYPFLQNKMRVGLLYFCRLGQYKTQHEMTLAWNYSPVKAFNVALSYSFLNSRQTFGWLLSFTPKRGVNIFLGSDYTAFKYSAHGYPVNTGYFDINFGLSVPIQYKYVE